MYSIYRPSRARMSSRSRAKGRGSTRYARANKTMAIFRYNMVSLLSTIGYQNQIVRHHRPEPIHQGSWTRGATGNQQVDSLLSLLASAPCLGLSPRGRASAKASQISLLDCLLLLEVLLAFELLIV